MRLALKVKKAKKALPVRLDPKAKEGASGVAGATTGRLALKVKKAKKVLPVRLGLKEKKAPLARLVLKVKKAEKVGRA